MTAKNGKTTFTVGEAIGGYIRHRDLGLKFLFLLAAGWGLGSQVGDLFYETHQNARELRRRLIAEHTAIAPPPDDPGVEDLPADELPEPQAPAGAVDAPPPATDSPAPHLAAVEPFPQAMEA